MRSTTALGFALGFGAMSLAAARVLRSARAIQLAGRTVVIVGGSRGLGLVMAREFAAEGAHVVMVARDEDELARALEDLKGRGFDATAIACDITERPQIERAVESIVAERGTIDVLVNNAGVIQVGPMAHMTVDDFEQAMATHFWGPLHTILAALPHMRRAG
jgi:NAD(P)-dependent dehydrogenase (short-subunit alcohol dehydrogenase family)